MSNFSQPLKQNQQIKPQTKISSTFKNCYLYINIKSLSTKYFVTIARKQLGPIVQNKDKKLIITLILDY